MEDTDENLPGFGLALLASPGDNAARLPRHSPSNSAASAVDANQARNCGSGGSGAGNSGADNSGTEANDGGGGGWHQPWIGGGARSAFHLVAPLRQLTPPSRRIDPSQQSSPSLLTPSQISPGPSLDGTDQQSPSLRHIHSACSSAYSSLDLKTNNEGGFRSLRLTLAPPLLNASPTPPSSQRVSPISPGFECRSRAVAVANEADCSLRLSIFPAPPAMVFESPQASLSQQTSPIAGSGQRLTLPTASQVRMAALLSNGEKKPVVRGLSLNFAEAGSKVPSAVASSSMTTMNESQPSDGLQQLLDTEPVRCSKRDHAATFDCGMVSSGNGSGASASASGVSPNKKPKHCWRPEKWRPAFPWAELHVRADGRQSMRCALCLRWCADEPTPFTRDGAVDLQRSTLRTHGKSRCHKKAMEREAAAAMAPCSAAPAAAPLPSTVPGAPLPC